MEHARRDRDYRSVGNHFSFSDAFWLAQSISQRWVHNLPHEIIDEGWPGDSLQTVSATLTAAAPKPEHMGGPRDYRFVERSGFIACQRWAPSTRKARRGGRGAAAVLVFPATFSCSPALTRARPFVELSRLAPTYTDMPWHNSPRFRRPPPAGFIVPCRPTLVANPPVGPGWLHEVKHDGFRTLARKQGERVEVWSRYGTDFTG